MLERGNFFTGEELARHLPAKQIVRLFSAEGLHELKAAFDSDGDGTVTVSEIIAECDDDGDGKIELEEFLRHLLARMHISQSTIGAILARSYNRKFSTFGSTLALNFDVVQDSTAALKKKLEIQNQAKAAATARREAREAAKAAKRERRNTLLGKQPQKRASKRQLTEDQMRGVGINAPRPKTRAEQQREADALAVAEEAERQRLLAEERVAMSAYYRQMRKEAVEIEMRLEEMRVLGLATTQAQQMKKSLLPTLMADTKVIEQQHFPSSLKQFKQLPEQLRGTHHPDPFTGCYLFVVALLQRQKLNLNDMDEVLMFAMHPDCCRAMLPAEIDKFCRNPKRKPKYGPHLGPGALNKMYANPPSILRKSTLRQLVEFDRDSVRMLLTHGRLEQGKGASVTFNMARCRRKNKIWNNEDGHTYTVYITGEDIKLNKLSEPAFKMKFVGAEGDHKGRWCVYAFSNLPVYTQCEHQHYEVQRQDRSHGKRASYADTAAEHGIGLPALRAHARVPEEGS